MWGSLKFSTTTDQRNRYTVRISSGAERDHRAKMSIVVCSDRDAAKAECNSAGR